MRPRVFTIPPSVPFLPTLIKAMTGRQARLPSPERSARTRRGHALSADAARLPAGARRFSRRARCRRGDPAAHRRPSATSTRTRSRSPKRRPAPLPRMRSLCRRRSADRNAACCWRDLLRTWARAPAVRGAQGMPLVAQTPAAACALADDLARLIDDMTMRGVSWDRLDGLVPESLDPYLAVHAEISADRAPDAGRDAARARHDRAGRAARRADQGRSRAACAQDRCTGDRRRLDRVDPGDRRTDCHHRAPAARRRGAAGPRHRSRRGFLAPDRRRRARRCLARRPAIRNSRCSALLARIGIGRDAVEQLAERARPRAARLGSVAPGGGDRALASARADRKFCGAC